MSIVNHAEVEMLVDVGDALQTQRAEAWAVGERNGVPVEEGNPTYHNSSKWHAQRAAEIQAEIEETAAGAAQSAANAATSESNAQTYANRANQQAAAASGSAISASNRATDAMMSATEAAGSAQAARAAANSLSNASARVTTLEPEDAATAAIVTEEGVKVFIFGIPRGRTGDTGAAGRPGKDFRITKTFPSIAAMEAYTGTDVEVNDWVMISSTVEDPDNAKIYVKLENSWGFITDMSGAQGIKGDTGNGIDSAVLNADYTLTLTFTNGATYTTPSIRGVAGYTPVRGTDYWTAADKAEIVADVNDSLDVATTAETAQIIAIYET